MIELLNEFAQAADKADAHAGWLKREFGLPDAVVKPNGRAVFGVGHCTFNTDGTYQPTEDGEKALIIAEAQSHERWKHSGKVGIAEVIDLIAVPFNARERWFLRRGMACLLGAENLEDASDNNPITVYATPLRWLQAGGDGLCIVNWESFDRWYFAQTFPLQFETTELAQRFFVRTQFQKKTMVNA